MVQYPRDVTDAELAVLEALWELRQATIRDLTERLYPEGTASQYATVQKLLERLARKGCVARKRNAGRNLFRAKIDRSALIGRRLQDVADRLCDGSLTPLLTHLVQARKLSLAEREQLRRLVADSDPDSSRGRGA